MSRKALSEWSDEELVARFLAISLEQDEAIRIDQSRKYNRLYEEMLGVTEEIRKDQVIRVKHFWPFWIIEMPRCD